MGETNSLIKRRRRRDVEKEIKGSDWRGMDNLWPQQERGQNGSKKGGIGEMPFRCRDVFQNWFVRDSKRRDG